MSRYNWFGNVRVLGAVGALGIMGAQVACTNTNIPDLNNSSVAGFQTNPTASGAAALVNAMLAGARDNTANVVLVLGSFGREGYSLSVAHADLPFYVVGPMTPGTFLTTMIWTTQYQDLREGALVLDNVSKITSLSAADQASLTGFVQTMQAFDLTILAMTRDTFGLPIAVDIVPTGPSAPIAPKAAVFQHILNLLDSGQTNLLAGGAAFSFKLPTGLAAFGTPATFVQVNRALRARVDIFQSNYAQALTDIAASFVSNTAPLTTGAYFNYTTTSGDKQNALFLPYLYASPRLVDSAQLQPGGAKDLRVLQKITAVPSFTFDGLTSIYQFTLYNSATTPLPMIRNEELILLRAEANLGLGNTAAALTDINFIRQNSGGLAPLASFATPADALTELLYEKRYSLMYEGGHAWIDAKHYNLFATLPAAIAGGHIFDVMPFALADCNGYSPAPAGCGTVVGIAGVAGEGP